MKKKTIYEPVKVEDATEEDKKQKFVVLRDYSVNGLAAWYDFPQGNIHNIHYLKQSEKYVFDDAELIELLKEAVNHAAKYRHPSQNTFSGNPNEDFWKEFILKTQ